MSHYRMIHSWWPSMYDVGALYQQLVLEEGYRRTPYFDSLGIETIGIGHNLRAAGLCSAAIRAQYDFDVAQAEAGLIHYLPWWDKIDSDGRKRALLDLAFNLGVPTLLSFTTFLNLCAAGSFTAAAADLRTNTLWCRQVGPERCGRVAGMIEAG